VAGRADTAAVVSSCGLEIAGWDADVRFEHRVDQAITRDILVARKL
jgi:hypothetical protein